MSDRIKIYLSDHERGTLRSLRPDMGTAFEFWRRIASDRNVDPSTIMLDGAGYTTALPLGHGKKGWCFPLPLKCKRPPINN